MKVEPKKWDSEFFHLRIGIAEIDTKEDSELLALRIDELRGEYDLLYVFDSNRIDFKAKGARLVDEKIVYSKITEHRQSYDDVMLYQQPFPRDYLYDLALVSGAYSRFKLDERLPKDSYERMYRKWIDNACPQEGTNKHIFVYYSDGKAHGMITVDYEGSHAKIGLAAVDPVYQHQGVGTKIMSTVEEYLYQQGVFTIEVVTQQANVDACRWYEKNGFVKQSTTNIYHWWLNMKWI